jgi:DNA-binding IclR family transcriptional regulator
MLFSMTNAFDKTNNEGGRAPAVDRALAVLKLLADAREPRGVSELSRAIGASKGTVHAILQALRAAGAVEDAPGRKYRLGPLVEELARGRRAGRTLADVCRAPMEALRDATGQTVMLGVLEGGRLQVVAVTEGAGTLRLGAAPGVKLPLLAGAPGKVALAWGWAKTPEKPHRFTEETVTDRRKLARELEAVRRSGVALDRGEFMRGVAAAAAPVLQGDAVRGILFAVGFRDELEEEGLAALGEAVRHAAETASREWGA